MRNHLIFKVIFILVASVVLLMTVASVFFFQSEKAKATEAMRTNSEQTANRLKNALIDPLWNVNIQGIDTIITLEMANTNIDAIVLDLYFNKHQLIGKIRNSKGEAVTFEGENKALAAVHGGFITATRVITRGSEDIGALTISYSDRELRANLKKLLFNIIIFTVFLSACIITALFFSIRLVILSPLLALEKAVQQIGNNDFSVRAPTDSSDEIGSLATAFNNMTGQIARSYQTLEEKVVERTKELDSAQTRLKEKLDEMERMNKLMIGRELTMIELKKHVAELEQKSAP